MITIKSGWIHTTPRGNPNRKPLASKKMEYPGIGKETIKRATPTKAKDAHFLYPCVIVVEEKKKKKEESGYQ